MSASLVLVFALALILPASCSPNVLVKFIQTSDLHSTFDETTKKIEEEDGSWVPLTYGGFPRVANIIESLKDECSVVVDTGDQFFGSVYFTFFGYEAILNITENIPYDVMTLGNHEFDLGYEALEGYVNKSNKDFINTSLDFSKSTLADKIHKYKIVELKNCNIIDAEAGDTVTETVKVGFLGTILADQVENTIFETGNVGRLDEFKELREYSKMLKEEKKVDMVVLLSHMGINVDEEAATQLPDVDVIIGGHSHCTLTERTLYTGLQNNKSDGFYKNPIVESQGPYPLAIYRGGDNAEKTNEPGDYVILSHVGAYGQHVGYLPIIFNKETGIVDANETIVRLDTSEYKGDTMPYLYDGSKSAVKYSHPLFNEDYIEGDKEVQVCLDGLNEELNTMLDEVIAETKYDLIGGKSECSKGETSMADVIADAYKFSAPKTRIAMLNAGGIRGGADCPDITRREVYEALPFDNEVFSFKIQGKYIREAFEIGMSDNNNISKGLIGEELKTTFLQMSGLMVYYDMDLESGHRVKDIKVCKHSVPEKNELTREDLVDVCNPSDSSVWEDLKEDEEYYACTNSYILDGNDGQTGIKENAKEKKSMGGEISILEVYLETIEKVEMPSEGDGRFHPAIVLTGSGINEGVVIGVVIAFLLVSVAAGVIAFFLSRKNKKGEEELLIK